MNIIAAAFAGSAVRPDQYPPEKLPQIALVGRSNVGKSSLINSLCRHRGLARVSGTPGVTRTINFYRLRGRSARGQERDFFLVDLPGYGYAKAGRGERRAWQSFMTEYLTASQQLCLLCLLVDVRLPPQDSDLAVYRGLSGGAVPVRLIATKADKLSRGPALVQARRLAAAFGLPEAAVTLYSAASGQGREELLDIFTQILLQ